MQLYNNVSTHNTCTTTNIIVAIAGEELDLDGFEQGCLIENFPEGCVPDRDATRQATTAHVFAQVQKAYDELIADTIKRDSPYYTRRADEPVTTGGGGGGGGGGAEPAAVPTRRAWSGPMYPNSK